MKVFKIFILLLCGFIAFSCNKEVTTPGSSPSGATATPAMSATINGTPYTLTASIANSNGYVFTGGSSDFTITLFLNSIALNSNPGYILAGQSSGYYAEVFESLGPITYYTTSSQTTPDLFITSYGSSTGTVNGNFSFTATESSPTPGGATITVTNGSFTNM